MTLANFKIIPFLWVFYLEVYFFLHLLHPKTLFSVVPQCSEYEALKYWYWEKPPYPVSICMTTPWGRILCIKRYASLGSGKNTFVTKAVWPGFYLRFHSLRQSLRIWGLTKLIGHRSQSGFLRHVSAASFAKPLFQVPLEPRYDYLLQDLVERILNLRQMKSYYFTTDQLR